MDDAARRLIDALHRAAYQYVLAVTGGGTQAAAMLLNVPGGSRTILEVHVPYHPDSLAEFLGCHPEQSCSPETSRQMARAAYERAAHLSPRALVAGAGCTASLATDRPKRGDHRFHLSTHTAHGGTTWSLTLAKGEREREGEEAILDAVLLNALAETFGVPARVSVPLLAGEMIQTETFPAHAALARLFRGELPAVCAEADGRLSPDVAKHAVLLPGSFNPLHAGHLEMADAASRLTGATAAFEMSVENVDKPPLSAEDLHRRMRQFAWRVPLWLTRAPLFVQKARLFPRATFVIGVDTAVRLVDPKYYGGSEAEMCKALDEVRSCGCRFLVAGRVDDAGRFLSLADVGVPPACRDLFTDIPEGEFRADVSSTRLRAEGKCPAAD